MATIRTVMPERLKSLIDLFIFISVGKYSTSFIMGLLRALVTGGKIDLDIGKFMHRKSNFPAPVNHRKEREEKAKKSYRNSSTFCFGSCVSWLGLP